jgi:peptidyl-prolyl cis-trans isomerase SurA
LQLIDVRSGGAAAAGPPVVQTRVRHILIRPEDGVGETEILRRLAGIRDRVLGGTAEFEDMARQYSVDGSAGRGGDIGWVYPGDTVPRFERAMNNLAPGEISEPVRTQFGFHLIQLIERREEAASQERQRRLARQEIIRKRTAEAYREWRAELRDRTYVELRLE